MQDPNTKLKAFLTLYFYQLEVLLNSNTTELEQIKFQSEEANTDEFIKLFFQGFIKNNNIIVIDDIEVLTLFNGDEVVNFNITEFENYRITNVFIPGELSQEQKKTITESKKSVYTNPDLLLQIEDGNSIHFESLELKSTKNNNIPGSSVQQVSPFEWVIFVKRSLVKIEVSTGHYINSITEKLPFPDRSPRPQIGFNTLSNWNKVNRVIKENQLIIIDEVEITNQKIKLLSDWQDFLATEWMSIITSGDDLKNNEKWFNNTLRKFAIKFLEYSEDLTTIERDALLKRLTSLIKE